MLEMQQSHQEEADSGWRMGKNIGATRQLPALTQGRRSDYPPSAIRYPLLSLDCFLP